MIEITLATPALLFPAISLLVSLWLSFFEVRISVGALDLQLGDVEESVK